MPEKIADHETYWTEFVEPDFEEFEADVDNLRKAFHCASSLFHMADWLYQSNKDYIERTFKFRDKNGNEQPVRSEQEFANAVRDRYPDFELMRGIAHAGKHLAIRKGQHAASPVSAANTYVISTGYGVGGYGMGPYGGAPRVVQQGPDGDDIEFHALARGVRQMWLDLCGEHGFALGEEGERT